MTSRPQCSQASRQLSQSHPESFVAVLPPQDTSNLTVQVVSVVSECRRQAFSEKATGDAVVLHEDAARREGWWRQSSTTNATRSSSRQ